MKLNIKKFEASLKNKYINIKRILNTKFLSTLIKKKSNSSSLHRRKNTNGKILLKTLSNFSLRKQLMAIFFLISIIPVIILGLVTFKNASEQVSKSQQAMLNAYTEGIRNNIDTTLDGADNILRSLSSQADLLVLLEHANSQGAITEVIRLNNILLSLKNAVKSSEDLFETVFITDNKGNIIADGSAYKDTYMRKNVANTDYFSRLNKETKFYVGEPFRSEITGHYVIPVARSVNTIVGQIGTMVIMFKMEKFTDFLEGLDIGETGHSFIISSQGTIIFHKNKDLVASQMANPRILDEISRLLDSENEDKGNGLVTYKENNEIEVGVFKQLDTANWIIASSINGAELYGGISVIRNTILIIISVLSIVVLAISIVFSRNISKPVSGLVNIMQRVAQGDLNQRAEYSNCHEISVLSSNFNDMLNNLQSLIKKIKNTSSEVQLSANQLIEISSCVFDSTKEMSTVIEEISAGAMEQVKDIEIGYEKTNILASKIDSVSAYSNMILDSSKKTDLIVESGLLQIETLSNISQESSNISRNVYKEALELKSEINKIGKLLETINQISRQTNLLALNAAIEAARAGDAGRGFSVVADEIRKLAEEVAKETADIRKIIDNVNIKTSIVQEAAFNNEKSVDKQSKVVFDTKDAFNSIYSTAEMMTENIRNSIAAMRNMEESKDDITQAIQGITKVAHSTAEATKNVNSTAQQQFSTIEEMNNFSIKLQMLSVELGESVKSFIIEG